MSLDQWSQTPASNDLPGYGNTGMRPSLVKNGFWDTMADVCQVIGTGSLPTSGGTANAQTITNTRQVAAWFPGMWVCWVPGFTSTAAMTISPDGLAAKNVFANGAAALAGMVVANVPAVGRYDGTQVNLINPQRSTGSFTLTYATGFGTTPTVTINYAILPDGKTAEVWCVNGQTNTSTTTGFTGTGVPSILTPANEKRVTFQMEDATTYAASGRLATGTSTTWTFYNGLVATSWTASGTKGILLGAYTSFSLD